MPNSKGFTLIELLIGLTVGTAVLATVAAVFVPSLSTYRNNQALATIQENERFLINQLNTSVAQAGYFGCDSTGSKSISNVTQQVGLVDSLNTPVIITPAGESGVAAGVLSQAAEDLRPEAAPGFPAGDVLTLVTTNTVASSLVNHNIANQTVTFRGDASRLSGQVITLNDCDSSAVFEVSEIPVITTVTVNGETETRTQFSYAAGTDNCVATGGTGPAIVLLGALGADANCNNPGNFSGDKQFGPGAIASQMITTSYFIGEAGDGIPSFYSVSASGAGFELPVRLVSGVDNMRVRYGVQNATSISYFTEPDFTGVLADTDFSAIEISLMLNSGVARAVRGNQEDAQRVPFIALDSAIIECNGTQAGNNELSACPSYMSDDGVASGQLRRAITKIFNLRNNPSNLSSI